MSPAAFNLLEAIVRTTIMIADNTLTKDRAETIRSDLTGKLTSLKVVMQHEKEESLLQPMAQVVLALGKHVLGRPVKISDGDVSQKDLLGIVNDLTRRSEEARRIADQALHPTGRCTCAGEGTCEWCQTHCVHCGSALQDVRELGYGTCPHCDEPCGLCGASRLEHEENKASASHQWIAKREIVEKALCPTCGSSDVDIDVGRCRCCGYLLDGLSQQAPEEPVIEDKTNEDIGLDPDRWKLITDMAGNPSVALYFNGGKDSLSQEQVEEIEEALLPIIQGWGR